MEPLTFGLIAILLIIFIGGVWGHTIITGIMQRRLKEGADGIGAELLDEVRSDHLQLEARVERMEEELEFLRALHAPKPPEELASPGGPGGSPLSEGDLS